MRFLLRPFAVMLIRYLQRKYKRMSIKNVNNQTNRVLSKLILIQSILYYFGCQFAAYGYFHPSCRWTPYDNDYLLALFPEKKFDDIDIVTYYNPHAINYYHNKIYELTKGEPPNYAAEIKKQLLKWDVWR